MAQLFDRQTGAPIDVPNEQVGDALSSGRFGAQPGQRFSVRDESGEVFNVPVEQLGEALGGGFRLESDQEAHEAKIQEKYGDTAGELLAGAAGAARGVSFGLSDALLTSSGFVEKDTLAGLKEANPTASILGEVAGVGASLLIPGGVLGAAGKGVRGVSRLAGAAERATAAALRGTEAGLARELLARGAGAAVGGAIEGAIYGTGQVVSEAALGDPAEVAENALAHIGVAALLGGAAGGLLGVGGELGSRAVNKAVEKGVRLAESKGLIREGESILETFAKRRAVKSLHSTQSKMGKLEELGRTEEVGADLLATHEVLGGQQVLGKSVAETLENIRTVRSDTGKKIGAALKEIDGVAGNEAPVAGNWVAQRLRKELLEPIASQPGYAAERRLVEEFAGEFEQAGGMTLTQANQVKSRLQKKIEKLFGHEVDSPANELRKKIAGIVREEVDTAAENVAKSAGREDLAQGFIEAKRLYGSMSEAEKLAKHGVKRIEGNRTFSLTDYMTGGFGGTVLGPGGVVLAAANKVARERGNLLLAKVANRAAKIQALHNIGTNVSGAIRKSADAFVREAKSHHSVAPLVSAIALEPPATSEVLLKVAYGPTDPDGDDTRSAAYKARVRELGDMMAMPEIATERIARRLDAVSDAAPEAAAALSQRAVEAAQFLYSKALKPPPPMGPLAVEPEWTPPDAAVRKFEAYVRAVEYPMTVVDDFRRGKLNPEGAEVLRTLYKGLHKRVLDAVTDTFSETGHKPTYQQLVQLSLLCGEPAHPTMAPRFIQRMQALPEVEQQQAPGPGRGPGGLRLSGLKDIEFSEHRKTEADRLLEGMA